MLHPDEETAVAERFGVARGQIRRDHLISHLLAAISTHAADEVIFFGGTALSRTIAPHAVKPPRTSKPAYCARRAGSSPACAGNHP